MRCLTLAGTAALLAAPLTSQVAFDHFNYPNGASVPGWTQHTGQFGINNGRLINQTGASTWSFITKDGLTGLNGVLDGEFFFVGSGVQFGGLTARFSSSNQTQMCKIQNNGGAADYDRVFYYNWSGGSTWADLTTPTLSAYCRMILLDAQGWMQIDADKDGIFEQTVGPHTHAYMTAGGIGMNVYGTSEMDNFEYHDAVLMEAPGSQCKIGTTYNMELFTPDANAPYVGGFALGNTGFQFGPYRIPVDPDPLFSATLANSGALGLSGITDATGKGTPSIRVPNNPGLVGADLFFFQITIDTNKPLAIGRIANEHHAEIIQ